MRNSHSEHFSTAVPQKADVVLNAANGSFVPRRRQHHLSREGLFILWRCARELYPLLAEHKYSDGLRIITAKFVSNDGRVSFGLL